MRADKKIVAIIPAHMASVRFPGKILYQFHGLPMIEHVRRRALLAENISRVIVATCDKDIADSITGFGGEIILTSNKHNNGSSRVAEAVSEVDCSHVVVLQGDEPLLIPAHLESLMESIDLHPDAAAWNATAPIEHEEELDRHSFVKCAINGNNRILYCFRRSPGFSDFKTQNTYIRKILGIFAYRKEFLIDLVSMTPGVIETAEFIEQMRIIEHGYQLQSVAVEPSLPSVNEPGEAEIITNYLQGNPQQQELLEIILTNQGI